MEEGQAKNEFKPPVASETVVESEAVVSDAPVTPKEPMFKDDRKKMSGGVIACIVILAVLAIGGIGFGVWAMLSQNDKIALLETDLANCAASNNDSTENVEVTCPDGTSTEIVKNVITNDLAQSLIKPYIGSFNYLNNIFDYGLNDDTKVLIAYANVDSSYVYDYDRDANDGSRLNRKRVGYWALNNEYMWLFGGDSSLAEKNYETGKTASFTYDNNGFIVYPFAGGGAGLAMFDIVKDAVYDDDYININVYHDKTSICDINYNDGYCVSVDGNGAVIDSIDQYNMRELINSFADRIPVYTMTFVKDDGHYVLNNIQKQ